ncbi:MAG: helix-turn-helix, type 11 domain protein [Verrucomicrobia bacterium]|nr:helix-turn-helix, type 11 domain protein [Verrucomicrobiota bacterium]
MAEKRPLPSSRPPLARMLRIHEILHDGRETNCTKLAAQLEVSTKTIMRDLAFMRDQLDLPTEYDPQTYSWRYTYPVKNFPTVQISEGELLALLVARKALEQYQGTPYHDQLAHAFEKLSSGLNDQISFSPTGTMGNVSFHQAGLGKSDLKLFEKLARAVNESKEVSFDYRKPQGAQAEARRVQPYHLANRENAWYLVGFDLERNALRNFALARMKSLAIGERKFVRPADFSPEKHFGKAFGAFVGTGDFRVTVRFDARAADQVRERFWHESQETIDLPDGRLEFTVQLGGLDEILRWILGWGDQAEVIAPEELRRLVQTHAEAMSARYRSRADDPGVPRNSNRRRSSPVGKSDQAAVAGRPKTAGTSSE